MSAGDFTFTLDAAGVKKAVSGPEMMAFIDGHAERCLGVAQQIAPKDSGEYADSLGINPATINADGVVEAELFSSSWKWHWVEFGSINNQAHHVLETAVSSSGLAFKASPR